MVSHIEKLLFTRELSVMLRSGVPIGEALTSFCAQAKRGPMKQLALSLLADIENGQLFSAALARFPKAFDALYINLVRIGETSGTLPENLAFLSREMDSSYAFRRKIQGIILYPALVLSMALVLGAAISIFILPRLIRLFDSFDIVLPLSTRILLSIASVMERYGIVIFAALFAVIILWRVLIALPAIKPLWHRVILSLPVFGSFSCDVALAHFCRDMGVMLKSGLPLFEALTTESAAMENRAVARLAQSLAVAVSQGRSLSVELVRPEYTIIPPLAIRMIAAGEKTGRLAETFTYLEEFYESETDRRIKGMTVLFEPLLLVAIGLVVAFLAAAIMTPIYSLTGSIHR
jgi:type II secretory pathway component PulF